MQSQETGRGPNWTSCHCCLFINPLSVTLSPYLLSCRPHASYLISRLEFSLRSVLLGDCALTMLFCVFLWTVPTLMVAHVFALAHINALPCSLLFLLPKF